MQNPSDQPKIEALGREILKAVQAMRAIDGDWHGDLRIRLAIKAGQIDFAGIEGANKTVKFGR